MGLVYSKIILSNANMEDLDSMEVNALVDTRAVFICIPERIAIQLKLKTLEMRTVTLADGSLRTVPFAGLMKVAFENRKCWIGALVMGEEVLLGAIPLEDMDLVVHPFSRKLLVDPANPNVAIYSAK